MGHAEIHGGGLPPERQRVHGNPSVRGGAADEHDGHLPRRRKPTRRHPHAAREPRRHDQGHLLRKSGGGPDACTDGYLDAHVRADDIAAAHARADAVPHRASNTWPDAGAIDGANAVADVRAIYVAHACANTEADACSHASSKSRTNACANTGADACSHASSKSRTNDARTNASTNELIASSHRRVLVASMSQPKASVQKQQVPLVLLGVVAGVMDQNAIYMVQKCTITAVELLSGSVTCICQDWPS